MYLKRCPFCGGKATKHCLNSKETIANGTAKGFKIRCIDCDASITRKGLCPVAITAWNLRITTEQKPACPKCGKSDKMYNHGNGWVCHHTHIQPLP